MTSITGMKPLKESTSSIRMMAFSAIVLLLLWGEMRQAEAGCQRFGHSCFGAHGKRSGVGGVGSSSNLEVEVPETNEYYPPSIPNNRIVSPYLMDWLLSASARRGQPVPILNYGGRTSPEDVLGASSTGPERK